MIGHPQRACALVLCRDAAACLAVYAQRPSPQTAFRRTPCAFDAAGTGSGKSGLALRLLMRAKCGASDEDGFQKDRQKLAEGPQEAGAKAAGFKTKDYLDLKNRITSYFGGDRNGFSKAGLDL